MNPKRLLALGAQYWQAMSRENVNLALEMYNAFNRRDWDAFLALAHDEVEVESRLVAVDFADLKSPYTLGHSRGVAEALSRQSRGRWRLSRG